MLEPQVITRTELFQGLEQGACLLTGNLRLSRFLGQNFARHAAADEQAVWLTPVIMPLQNWLEQAREADYNLSPSLFVDVSEPVVYRPLSDIFSDLEQARVLREKADLDLSNILIKLNLNTKDSSR